APTPVSRVTPPGCLARGADQAGAGAPLCAAHGLLAIPPSQAALRRSIRVQQTSWRNAFAREVLERSARSLSSPRRCSAAPRSRAVRRRRGLPARPRQSTSVRAPPITRARGTARMSRRRDEGCYAGIPREPRACGTGKKEYTREYLALQGRVDGGAPPWMYLDG